MTLREFFDYLDAHPYWIIGYFLVLPMLAFSAGFFGKDRGHESPWKYLYMLLIYGVCIPGILAVAFSVYMFVFERGSIMDTKMYSQVLPFLTMALTLAIIRRNVSFDLIPGFGRVSSLMMLIASVFVLMYLVDRTHIFAFVYMRVEYLLLIVIGMLVLIRFAFKKIIA